MAGSPSTAQELVIAGFGGLSVYSDSELRTKDTWQQLDNFDLVIDGSIRKILPAVLIAGPFPNPLYQLLEYRKAINFQGGGLRVIAIDNLGNLWDVNGSIVTPYSTSLLSQLTTIVDIPFMGQMQGYYIQNVGRGYRFQRKRCNLSLLGYRRKPLCLFRVGYHGDWNLWRNRTEMAGDARKHRSR